VMDHCLPSPYVGQQAAAATPHATCACRNSSEQTFYSHTHRKTRTYGRTPKEELKDSAPQAVALPTPGEAGRKPRSKTDPRSEASEWQWLAVTVPSLVGECERGCLRTLMLCWSG